MWIRTALYLLRCQRGVGLEHLRDDGRNDRRREGRSIDIFVVPGDDVLAADLESNDLPNTVYRPIDSGIKLGINSPVRG